QPHARRVLSGHFVNSLTILFAPSTNRRGSQRNSSLASPSHEIIQTGPRRRGACRRSVKFIFHRTRRFSVFAELKPWYSDPSLAPERMHRGPTLRIVFGLQGPWPS